MTKKEEQYEMRKWQILDIALNYGFSSHEAFTRAFKTTYGIDPESK